MSERYELWVGTPHSLKQKGPPNTLGAIVKRARGVIDNWRKQASKYDDDEELVIMHEEIGRLTWFNTGERTFTARALGVTHQITIRRSKT